MYAVFSVLVKFNSVSTRASTTFDLNTLKLSKIKNTELPHVVVVYGLRHQHPLIMAFIMQQNKVIILNFLIQQQIISL